MEKRNVYFLFAKFTVQLYSLTVVTGEKMLYPLFYYHFYKKKEAQKIINEVVTVKKINVEKKITNCTQITLFHPLSFLLCHVTFLNCSLGKAWKLIRDSRQKTRTEHTPIHNQKKEMIAKACCEYISLYKKATRRSFVHRKEKNYIPHIYLYPWKNTDFY